MKKLKKMEQEDFKGFKNESYFNKLKSLAFDAPKESPVFVFFGGTGAVGGRTVIEIIQDYEFVISVNPDKWLQACPFLIITGKDPDEIETYKLQLENAFKETNGFEIFNNPSKNTEPIILKRKSGITIELHKFPFIPEFENKSEEYLVELIKANKIYSILDDSNAVLNIIKPCFTEKLRDFISQKQYNKNFKFKAIISGIPIPSVAAYGKEMNKKISKILENARIMKDPNAKKGEDVYEQISETIKKKILHNIANDFGFIRKNMANKVLIAHTTSVGGMYKIVNGNPRISLGYAHSAQDADLIKKQEYAEFLTLKYNKAGVKILITAAAIGIDAVMVNKHLPMKEKIYDWFNEVKKEDGIVPFNSNLTGKDKNSIPIIKPISISIKESSQRIIFKAFTNETQKSKKIIQPMFQVRSGENGILSLDNAYALFLNMKVASQEELAHILAYNALFGDDKQRPWFDEFGICYQPETENATLIFSFLNNNPQFRAYQTSGFTPKAFQNLGSAKHQCELHTIGLYMLLHRLKTIKPRLPDIKDINYNEKKVVEFVENNTKPLLIEDIIRYKDPMLKAKEFSSLLRINTIENMAAFTGFVGDLNIKPNKTFFNILLKVVKQTIYTITTLGSPIVYLDKDKVKILIGPYVAPVENAIKIFRNEDDLYKYIKLESNKGSINPDDLFEWIVCNNGFIDLRPQGTISKAKTIDNKLKGEILIVQSFKEFRKKIIEIQNECNKGNLKNDYFTSSGIVAFVGRITGLAEQLRSYKVTLGTLNNWKALFPVDSDGNHPVIPGLVEAMRHYTEGLGKVTGFELLYPGFGYYRN
jgi:hypothetical protein